MPELDIGEVHRRTGLPPSTLRYYERRGLIRPSGRNGLRRSYQLEVLERLALVRAAQAAGFSLAETAELFEVSLSSETDLRQRLAAKADELDDRIDQLVTMRDRLRHAVDCTSPTLAECTHFRRSIQGTGPSRSRPRNR